MRLRHAASLWIAAVLSATGAIADMKAVRVSPSFTAQEIDLIAKDQRLVDVVRRCARQLRQALDALREPGESAGTSRVGMALEPCPSETVGHGRGSDEGALDILKILKDISEPRVRTARADTADSATRRPAPLFTAEDVELIQKSGNLMYAARRCAWSLRHALDSMRYGAADWPPQRPCWPPKGENTRGNDEGALDILKILREASGDSNN